MSMTKQFCSHCGKEYVAKKSVKVFHIQLYKSHGCEEQLKVEEAKRKHFGYGKPTKAR